MNECEKCGKDLTGARPWVQVTGWVKLRNEGGANQVVNKKRTGKLMCEGCIVLLKSGPHKLEGQLELDG